MEENLETFVNLLNQYRQHRPVPKALSRLPNWAQRELSKRPEPIPRQDAQLNTTPREDKPKPEIAVAAKPAEVQPQAVALSSEVSPRVDVLPDQPKDEVRFGQVETPASALDPIDPKRDPEGWLARILSEEGDKLVLGHAPGTIASTTGRKASDKVAQTAAEQSEAGTQVPEKKMPGENQIETPPSLEMAKPGSRSSEATELVPLQPVIVTRMGSARRVPVTYAPAAAAIALIVLGVGGYWLFHTKPRLVADIKTIGPKVVANIKSIQPPPTAVPAPKSPIAVTAPASQRPKTQVAEITAAPATSRPFAAVKPATAPRSPARVAEASTAASVSPPKAAPAVKSETRLVPPQAKIAGTQSTAAVMPPPAAPQTMPMISRPLVATTLATTAVALPKTASVTSPRDSTELAMLLTTPPPPTNKVAVSPTPSAPSSTIATGEKPTWQRNAMPAPAFQGQPQIAIVIDDLGLDRNRTERAIALKGPITLSFLAYASDLPEQTEAARRAGHELVVHVPMEPILRPKLVTQMSSGGEPPHDELLRRLRWDLSRFSGYVGVDNHLGNRLSTDPESTEAVINELKARGLVFLDSRSGGSSALSDAARKGVPTVTRDVLLDDDVTVSSVNDRLSQLEAIARQRGTAIAVGHPHDLTLDALKAWIAGLSGKGLQLVPLTAIVRDREQHEVRAD